MEGIDISAAELAGLLDRSYKIDEAEAKKILEGNLKACELCSKRGILSKTYSVGGFGALVSSTFFSAYGISPSWITANVIIALVVGTAWSFVKKTKKRWFKMLLLSSSIILGCALGLILSKTLIECHLYDIPFEIKVVKNSVAFVADCSCMLMALPIIARISKTKGNEE